MGRNALEQQAQIMGLGDLNLLPGEEGLQVLLGTLLGMKTHGVPRDLRGCKIIFDIEEIMLGFFHPLSDNLHVIRLSGHTVSFLLAGPNR